MAEPQGRNTQHTETEAPAREDRTDARKDGERRPSEKRAFGGSQSERGVDYLSMTPAHMLPDYWETWRPFAPMALMQSEMARWMDDFWRSALSARPASSVFGRMPTAGLPIAGFGLPRADLKETADRFQVHVELPGLKRQDIDVRLDGDDLLIRGTKADAGDHKAADYHLSERRFGEFERRIPLPHEIDRDAAKAEFHDGVLDVTLPKRADHARGERRIEVRG